MALGRKKPLDYATIDLASFLRGTVPFFADQLGEAYSVEMNISNEPVMVQGDPAYLKRILQNLFGNARDAMPSGGTITVECFIAVINGGSTSAVVRISDTGLGIPHEIAERIFEPFYTTKKKGKGTGLGLALCKRIIALHKGTIVVEETNNRGACFRIDLPLSVADGHTLLDTRTIMMNRIQAKVLIVDDDPKMREVLREFLSELAYSSFEAATAEEAGSCFAAHSGEISVVVMDWRLGAESPVDLIRSLKRIRRDIIIVVVSGYPPEKEIMRKHGIARWLTKPYEKDKLDFEIQKALYLAGNSNAVSK